MPADYLHATSDSCRTVTRLLTVNVCRWDCATCFVRHKLMQSNCIINSCHFVKPSHKERTLGNHTITSFDISTLCSVICSQVQWIPMDSRKCLRWWKSCRCEHYEIAGKLICVCVFLEEVWHWCNRKALTTWRFWEDHYEVIQHIKDKALIYYVDFRVCISAFYKREASEGDH